MLTDRGHLARVRKGKVKARAPLSGGALLQDMLQALSGKDGFGKLRDELNKALTAKSEVERLSPDYAVKVLPAFAVLEDSTGTKCPFTKTIHKIPLNLGTAALLATGNVFAWGGNDHGQLGNGAGAGVHTPAMVSSPADLRFSRLRRLSCGPNSTAAWT